MASDFWVFVLYRVEVRVARLNLKFISWRRTSSSPSVGCSVLLSGGRYSGPLLTRKTTAHHGMLFTGVSTSARVAVNDGIGYKAQRVNQLLCIAPVFPYGLVIFSRAPLHEVYGELPLCGLSVCSDSSRKHLGAKLGIVCGLFMGLGQVPSVPLGLLHHVFCSAMAFSAPRNAVLSPSVVMWLIMLGSESLRNSLQISSTAWSSLLSRFW